MKSSATTARISHLLSVSLLPSPLFSFGQHLFIYDFFSLFFLMVSFLGWKHTYLNRTERNGRPKAGSSHQTVSGVARKISLEATLSWDRELAMLAAGSMITVECRFNRSPASTDSSTIRRSRWAIAAVIGGSHNFSFIFFYVSTFTLHVCLIFFNYAYYIYLQFDFLVPRSSSRSWPPQFSL